MELEYEAVEVVSGRVSWRIKDLVGDSEDDGKRLGGGEACRRIVRACLRPCSIAIVSSSSFQ